LNRTGRQGHIVFFNWNVLPALRDRTSGFKAALSDIENVNHNKELSNGRRQ
jgi:hypothetical protein